VPQLTDADAVDCALAAADLAAHDGTDTHPAAFYRGVCAGLLMAVEGLTVAEASERTGRLVRAAAKRATNGKK
jgi:hypothetical protein